VLVISSGRPFLEGVVFTSRQRHSPFFRYSGGPSREML